MQAERKEWIMGINERYEDGILVETTVNTADRGGVGKVLSLEAEVKRSGTELLDKEAEVSGKVNYRLLYLDRQDRLCGLDYFKDFKCKVAGEKITPNGKCEVCFTLPEAEAVIAGEDVTLSAAVNVSLRYFGEEGVQSVADVSEAECKKGEILTQTVKKSERTVEVEKSAEVGTSVKKILLFSVDPVLTSVTQKGEETEVAGEARANIVYLNEADETAEIDLSMPFTERYEGEANACYHLAVKSARVVLADDEEGNTVEVEATLVIEQILFEDKVQNAVVAVCGEKSQALEQSAELPCRLFKGQAFYSEVLRGEIPLDKAGAYLCFVRPGCYAMAEVRVEDGAVFAEGVASFRAVYLAEDNRDFVQGELPFAFRFPFAEAKAGQEAEVRLLIGEPKATYTGKNVVIEAKVTAEVSLYEEKPAYFLSDVQEGEPIPESEAGISVYFAEKGEDVWQIAKSMGVLPSALIKANPFLAEPLEEDKKVLVFRQK